MDAARSTVASITIRTRSSCRVPARTVSGCGRTRGTTGGPPPGLYARSVLRIDQETHDAIVAHAKRDHTDEACGVVAGPEGSDRPERFVPMVNAASSPTF